jgi:hypothetical protein
MPTQDDPVQVYQELSDCYQRRNEPPMRDRFLVLAADAALRAGRILEADRFRLRLLKLNPHHLLKPYASFTQAMQAPDVQTYVRDLRLNYPPEVALILLNSLRTADTTMPATAAASNPKPLHPDDDATVALGEPTESLKVFPDQHESDLAETAALPKELIEMTRRTASQPPAPAPQTPAPAKNTPHSHAAPATMAKKKPLAVPRPEPITMTAAQPPLPTSESKPATGGGWFATVLFAFVLASALALAAFTFARPFWQ